MHETSPLPHPPSTIESSSLAEPSAQVSSNAPEMISATPAVPTPPAFGPEPAAQPAERRLGRRRRRRRHRKRRDQAGMPGPSVNSGASGVPVWSGASSASEPLTPIPDASPASRRHARREAAPVSSDEATLRGAVAEDGSIRYRMWTRQKLGWKYLLREVFD